MNRLPEDLELVHGSLLKTLSPTLPKSTEVERMAAKARRISDARPRRTTHAWQIAAAAAVVVSAIALAVTLAQHGRAPSPPSEGIGATNGSGATIGALEGAGDSSLGESVVGPLQDPNVPGISLDEVFAKIGRRIPLPQPSDATVSKAVYFPAPDGSSSNFELAVLYSSGFELRVIPGEVDLDRFAQEVAPLAFRDGRNHLRREQVGKRDVLVILGGVQAGAGDGHVVHPVAIWNESGLAYSLFSPGDGTHEVERLTDIVSTVR